MFTSYLINQLYFLTHKMKMKCLIAFLFLLLFVCNNGYCVTELLEETEKQGSTAAELDNISAISLIDSSRIIRIVESTGLVIVIIVVFLYFIRKKLGIKSGMGGNKRYIHIAESVPLGSKKYIHLVKVPGRVLLIGAANEQIQLLTEITDKDIVDSIEYEAKNSEFMWFFKRASTERA